jgi:glycosyltransferase involved in cell wall biosynthesis
VGGYDEIYIPAYCEDADLALNAWEMGFKVLISPKSWVIHHEGVSHGKSTLSGIKRHQIANSEKLKKKWVGALDKHWVDQGKARIEYSRNSKGIVVLVDRQLPSLFRDSGSVRTVKIAKHIQELGYHVVLTALDSATTQVDVDSLRNSGIEVHINLNSAFTSLESRKERITHAWLIRTEVIETCEPLIFKLNPEVKFIADILDLDYQESSSGFRVSEKQLAISLRANQVVLVSELESQILQNSVPGVEINTIWYEFENCNLGQVWQNTSGLLFVGGFRHFPNVEGILWFSQKVFPLLRDLGFDGKVRVVGTGLEQKLSQQLSADGFEILGRQDDLGALYASTRVVIAPLLSGRGKKGKIAEALSFGCPTVTTSVGAESFYFRDLDGVAVGNSPEEFARHIYELYSNWITETSTNCGIVEICILTDCTKRQIDKKYG